MINRGTVIHQRGISKEDFPQYVLLQSDEDNNTNDNLISLTFARSKPIKIKMLNIQVRSDDTLQALALRYRCTVAELKRINRIDKENEIYAKSHIKVPIYPFSILSEMMDNPEYDISNIQETDLSEKKEISDISPSISTLTESSSHSDTEINKIILNSVCEPVSYNYINEALQTEDIEENERLLIQTNNSQIADSSVCCSSDIFNCSGDDCGLSWRQVFIYAFLLVFVAPVLYIYAFQITNALKPNVTRLNIPNSI